MKGLGYLFGRLALVVTLVGAVLLGAGAPVKAATVNKTFTTHSQAGGSLLVMGGEQFSFSVSGSFVGTVQLQRSRNGADFVDVVGLSETGAYSANLQSPAAPGQRTYYRVFCSTHTSGSIVTSLADVNDVVQEFDNHKGVAVLTIYDDGVTATITAGTIDTAPLATDSVTNAKIINGAVDSSKLATASVDTGRLATDSVTNVKIINGAVDTLKIKVGVIDTSRLFGTPSCPNGSALCAGPGGRIGCFATAPTTGACNVQ